MPQMYLHLLPRCRLARLYLAPRTAQPPALKIGKLSKMLRPLPTLIPTWTSFGTAHSICSVNLEGVQLRIQFEIFR